MMSRAIVFILALLFVGCDDESKVRPPAEAGATTAGDLPSQVTYNTTLQFSSSGSTRAILRARRIRTYETQRYTLLDSNVRVDFYNRDGKHTTILTARRAHINDINKNMTAYDSVHIVSDSGTTVDTDSMVWVNSDQKLRSDAFVRIVEPNGRVTTGQGFRSDQNLTNYQIIRPTIVAPPDVLRGNDGRVSRPTEPQVPGSTGTFSTPLGSPGSAAPASTLSTPISPSDTTK